MNANDTDVSTLRDDELWRRTAELASRERGAIVDLVEHLAELDQRDLWKKHEYMGLFEYCVVGLRLSEDAAYKRIRAARAIRTFPPIAAMMRDGRLSLSAVVRLQPFLEFSDAATLVRRAAGLRVRKLEAMLAERQPAGPRRDMIRFGPAAPTPAEAPPAAESVELPLNAVVDTVSPMFAGASPPSAPAPRAPAPARSVRFSFTADEEFYRLLERVRALMRHKYPDGRLEGVLRDALKALLERKDPVIRWESGRRRR